MSDFPASRARAHYLASLERKIFLFHDEDESVAFLAPQIKPLVDALADRHVVGYSCNGPDVSSTSDTHAFRASWSIGDEQRMQTHTLPFVRSTMLRKGAFFAVIGLGRSSEIAARFVEHYKPEYDPSLNVGEGDYPILVLSSPSKWFIIRTTVHSQDVPLPLPLDSLLDFIVSAADTGKKFSVEANDGLTIDQLRINAKARKIQRETIAKERGAYNLERRALQALKDAGDNTIVVPPKLPKLHAEKKLGVLRELKKLAPREGFTPRYQKITVDVSILPDPHRPFHTYVVNPSAEPVAPTTIDNLTPLMEWLDEGESLPEEELRVDFERGSLLHRNGLAVDLCKQVVGAEGIGPILDAVGRNKNIGRFLLGNNVTGISGATAMAAFLADPEKCQNVYHFYIAGNNIDPEGTHLISDALMTNTTLTALWLKRNPIMPAGAVHLANVLRTNNTLQTLDLVNCGILDEGAIALFDAIKSATLSPTGSGLRHLYLGTNGLTPRTAEAASQLLKTGQSRLHTLFFACGRIQDEGAILLAEGLQHDRELMSLCLASECITAQGGMALADAIATHPKMCCLDLGFRKATFAMGEWPNVLGDEGCEYIIRTLLGSSDPQAHRIGIHSLTLTNNGASAPILQKLVDEVATKNKHIQVLDLHQFGAQRKGKDSAFKAIEVGARRICRQNKSQFEEYGRLLDLTGDEGRKNEWLSIQDTLNPRHLDDIFSVYRTNM